MPICLECGQKKKALSYSHLKSCCGLTPKQYKLKYPNSELMDEMLKLSMSHMGDKNGNYKGGPKKKHCPSCSKEKSSNGIHCRKCAQKLGKFSQPHNKEVRQKMSIAQQNRDPLTRYVIPATKEIIAKREAAKRKVWKNMDPEEKYKKLNNFIQSGKRKKDTSIELKLDAYFKDLGLLYGEDYQRNVNIGPYNVDFLINNLYVIEAYGDYWHKNPNIFPENHEKRKKDLIRKQWLESEGYYFCFFWESDIHNNFDKIDKAVAKLFGSYYNLFEWESCSCM